ncbi:hypothetical protein JVU11DRAFT_2351 [Chiua virens]|nr:hypothetical protein JVU11DRAFT_2351 [Chiua virens]
MFVRSALLIAGAGLAATQSLSSPCSSALFGVALDTTCLDFFLLAPLALSNPTTSVVPTVNSWLTGMCNQGTMQ